MNRAAQVAAIGTAVIAALDARRAGEVCAEVVARVSAMDGWTGDQVIAEGQRVGDILACGGDGILFPPPPLKRKANLSGPTMVTLTKEQAGAGFYARDFTREELRDALLQAYAIGSLAPGGVTWLGLHFCTMPHKGCPAGSVPPEDPNGAEGAT